MVSNPAVTLTPEPSPDVPGGSLRLKPIERPRGIILRLFNWLVRRMFGKVMMPAKVIYARLPTLLWRSLPLYLLVDRGLSIETDLRNLIQVHVAALNGCSFCHDMHLAVAMRDKTNRAKLEALDEPGKENSPLNARERSALRYVEEIARGGASSEAFEALRACFSEKEIVEITWLQAFTTYLLRMALPLGIGSDGFCALQEMPR